MEHHILDRLCATLCCSVNSYLHHIEGESGPGSSKLGKDNPGLGRNLNSDIKAQNPNSVYSTKKGILLESALSNNKKETQVKI